LENYTIAEIIKSYQNCGREPFIYYYRDRDSKEIDLIIEGDGKLCPVEIKRAAMPDKRLVKSFSIIDKSPLKRGTGAILCLAEKLGAFDKDNLIVPIWLI
jgi:predicted AAA+ superfamily ATPase